MPKHIFKRFLPDPKLIREHKYLQMFGTILHNENLWHMNRHSVARAFAIGLFTAFLPIPFQMVVAAALAILWRGNLPISVCLVWITNPFTMPPIFFFCYKVGTTILRIPHEPFHMELSLHWLETKFLRIWEPLLLGSVICGIIAALIGYGFILLFWRLWVIRAMKHRKERHRRLFFKRKDSNKKETGAKSRL
ncbi:MAG: ATP-binding protein [Legionellales bacterium]|nr:ATP-binding protein [Legionellales bacterium]|tara:strand:+ start:45559 stop:46134 length:576 start_codon:yes stop_codon:yes gene_type:complete